MVTALLVKLGIWQISRAQEKERLLDNFAQRQLQTVFTLANLPLDAKGLRLSLTGDFDETKSILLDNQTYQGRVGYRWMVPFLADEQSILQGKWILVDIGWIPAMARRETLPWLPNLSGKYLIEGIFDLPSSRILLKNETQKTSWPLRVQRIDLNTISKETNKIFLPWVARLQSRPYQDGLSLDWKVMPIWKPVVMLPEKHYSYAAQWFGLALMVLIGNWVWWKKEKA